MKKCEQPGCSFCDPQDHDVAPATTYRQRAWHDATVEDSDGRMVFVAASPALAAQLVILLNAVKGA